MDWLTLLVQNDYVATGKVDGVRSTEAGHCGIRSASALSCDADDGQYDVAVMGGWGLLTAAADDDDAGCHGEGIQRDWGCDKGQEATLAIVRRKGDGGEERRREEAWTGGLRRDGMYGRTQAPDI